VTKKVHVTRDVVFKEQEQWDWSAGGDRGKHDGDDTFTVDMEYSTVNQEEELADAGPGSPDPVVAASPTPQALSPSPSPRGADGIGGQSVEMVTPPAVQDNDLDADHDNDAPLHFRTMDNILGPTSS
jgi:hypothetical protein